MKPIEEMAINEISDLKVKYCDEFRELVKSFLKERPMIEYIWLYERSYSGWPGDSVALRVNDLSAIDDIKLKGEEI